MFTSLQHLVVNDNQISRVRLRQEAALRRPLVPLYDPSVTEREMLPQSGTPHINLPNVKKLVELALKQTRTGVLFLVAARWLTSACASEPTTALFRGSSGDLSS